MKIATYIISLLALGLIIFNLFQIDWEDPWGSDNQVVLITILAAMCAIVLLQILRISKKIEAKHKNRKNV